MTSPSNLLPSKVVLTTEQVRWGVEEFFERILRLQRKKNEDYAKNNDGLRNFRETAQRLNVPMPKVFLTHILKHLIALENAASKGLELNEGVEDRLLDVACYSAMLHVALREDTLTKRKEWKNEQ